MRVAHDANLLATRIGEVKGILSPRILDEEEHNLEFALSKEATEEVIDTVVARAVEGKHGLRELSLKTKSLEEVFFQLTK